MRAPIYAALCLAFPPLCAATAAVAAAATTASSFSIDTARPGPPLSRVLVDSFGSSHGSTTLRATWRQHFSQTLRDIPFHRVRFHGILDDDMSAHMPAKGGAFGGASGGLIFDTLDFFVQSGITPTVELSYMPAALALNTSAYYRHYMGLRSTFASAPAWRAFITGLIQLMIDRYGAATVRSWRFEVWSACAACASRPPPPRLQAPWCRRPHPPHTHTPNPTLTLTRRAQLRRLGARKRVLPRLRAQRRLL